MSTGAARGALTSPWARSPLRAGGRADAGRQATRAKDFEGVSLLNISVSGDGRGGSRPLQPSAHVPLRRGVGHDARRGRERGSGIPICEPKTCYGYTWQADCKRPAVFTNLRPCPRILPVCAVPVCERDTFASGDCSAGERNHAAVGRRASLREGAQLGLLVFVRVDAHYFIHSSTSNKNSSEQYFCGLKFQVRAATI